MAESVSSEPPTEIQATVRNYFATPVIVAELPDAAALNSRLRESILEREKTSLSTDHSNLGAGSRPGISLNGAAKPATRC